MADRPSTSEVLSTRTRSPDATCRLGPSTGSRTADVNGSWTAPPLVITCTTEGALAVRARRQPNARLLLMPDAAHDRGFAMTSSFSAMFLAGALAFGLVDVEAPARLAVAATGLMSRVTALAGELVGRGFERVVYLGSNELRGLLRRLDQFLFVVAGQALLFQQFAVVRVETSNAFRGFGARQP